MNVNAEECPMKVTKKATGIPFVDTNLTNDLSSTLWIILPFFMCGGRRELGF